MIKVSHVIVFQIVFIFDLGRHEERSKNMKNGQFLVFSAVVVRCLKILGRIWKCRAINLDIKYFDIITTEFGKNFESIQYICVPIAFYFDLKWSSGGRRAETFEECWNLGIFSRLRP